MQKKKPGLSKSFIRKIESKTLGKFCHAKSYRGGLDIGRNDPCRCGSGKKYKHCCLKKVAE